MGFGVRGGLLGGSWHHHSTESRGWLLAPPFHHRVSPFHHHSTPKSRHSTTIPPQSLTIPPFHPKVSPVHHHSTPKSHHSTTIPPLGVGLGLWLWLWLGLGWDSGLGLASWAAPGRLLSRRSLDFLVFWGLLGFPLVLFGFPLGFLGFPLGLGLGLGFSFGFSWVSLVFLGFPRLPEGLVFGYKSFRLFK